VVFVLPDDDGVAGLAPDVVVGFAPMAPPAGEAPGCGWKLRTPATPATVPAITMGARFIDVSWFLWEGDQKAKAST
jgi:hypothetical protein